MRKLTAPSWDAFEVYEEIAKASHHSNRARRDRLEDVRAQYRLYVEHRPHVEQISPLDVQGREKSALGSCYATELVAREKTRIRDRQSDHLLRTHCQLCGSMNEANTFDHYMPRSLFPEFSACAYNLVPTCSDCNNPHGNEWLDAQGRRLLHMYYDEIDEGHAYLHASIHLDRPLPRATFDVRWVEGGSQDFFDRYKRHFSTLELGARYARHSIKEIWQICGIIRSHGDRSTERIKMILLDLARTEISGMNSPRAALYRAAASEAFIEFARSTT